MFKRMKITSREISQQWLCGCNSLAVCYQVFMKHLAHRLTTATISSMSIVVCCCKIPTWAQGAANVIRYSGYVVAIVEG